MDRRLLDYLQRILNARVYDVAIESPLDLAKKLSGRLGNQVWLKREDKQPVHSFKLRGAYNKMINLSPLELARGVICASAGNHAQGVALSARQLGCQAVIVMPVTTPELKSDAVRAYGSKVILHGDSYSDAYAHALELEKRHDYVFVHPFDDPDVIAGQGTIGMEILRQHQHPIHPVFVAIGGGGLISGVAAYIKAVRPEIKVVGIQMADSDAMIRSIRAGQLVTLADVGLFSDGTAVKIVSDETFSLTRELVDDFVTVDTDEVCAAIKDAFEDEPQQPGGKPATFNRPTSTIARLRPMVAICPLLAKWNCSRDLPCNARRIVLARKRPCCMATGAVPGSGLPVWWVKHARSPATKTFL